MLWFEDRAIEGSVAPFDLTDRGLSLGDGVFDTALALNGRIAFEDRHRDRLVAAARSLGFVVSPERVGRAMRGLAGQGPGQRSAMAIRTTVTRGTGPRGLRPPSHPEATVFATAAPVVPGTAFAPLRLWPTAIRRNQTSPASRLKTLGYLDAVLAAAEAADQGFDEALFLNTAGHVACAGTGNLFAVLDGTVVTPPLEDGVLPGIVRGAVLSLARDRGVPAVERSLVPAELDRAEAVFLTNSLRLLAPVTAIGAHAVPSVGQPVVAALQEGLRRRVADACGASPDAVP